MRSWTASRPTLGPPAHSGAPRWGCPSGCDPEDRHRNGPNATAMTTAPGDSRRWGARRPRVCVWSRAEQHVAQWRVLRWLPRYIPAAATATALRRPVRLAPSATRTSRSRRRRPFAPCSTARRWHAQDLQCFARCSARRRFRRTSRRLRFVTTILQIMLRMRRDPLVG